MVLGVGETPFLVGRSQETDREASKEARVVVGGNNLTITPPRPGKMVVSCPGRTRGQRQIQYISSSPNVTPSHDHGIPATQFSADNSRTDRSLQPTCALRAPRLHPFVLPISCEAHVLRSVRSREGARWHPYPHAVIPVSLLRGGSNHDGIRTD